MSDSSDPMRYNILGDDGLTEEQRLEKYTGPVSYDYLMGPLRNGVLIQVHEALDLREVGLAFIRDDKRRVRAWLDEEMIVKATEASEAEDNPFNLEGAAEMFEAMGKYNEELVKAGIMLAADGLKPSKFGKRVYFDGTKRSVTDGPFAETKELVAGYWIWQVRSIEEAVEWAKRCPNPMGGQSVLEIRPIGEVEDLGPEIASAVNERRAKIGNGTT